jgi:hypothetical protein
MIGGGSGIAANVQGPAAGRVKGEVAEWKSGDTSLSWNHPLKLNHLSSHLIVRTTTALDFRELS